MNIYIDGEFCCGLDELSVLKHRLKENAEITGEQLEKIQRDSEGSAAFEKAVAQVSVRPRTEKEIRDYLKGKGYLDELIEKTVAKLKEYRYIDDLEFCRFFIASKKRVWGSKKIKFEIRRYSPDPECVDTALGELEPQYDEALILGEKYLRGKKEFDRNKLYAHLYSKGFTNDEITEAISALKEVDEREE